MHSKLAMLAAHYIIHASQIFRTERVLTKNLREAKILIYGVF